MIRCGKFDAQQRVRAYEFVLDLYDNLYYDGNFGFYFCRISETCISLAEAHRDLVNIDEMCKYLERATDSIISFDTREDGKYTALFVNTLQYKKSMCAKNYTCNDSVLLLKK